MRIAFMIMFAVFSLYAYAYYKQGETKLFVEGLICAAIALVGVAANAYSWLGGLS